MKPVIKNLKAKLERLKAAHHADLLRWAKESAKNGKNKIERHNYAAPYLKRAERPLQDLLPLQYRVQRNVFVNYKESCAFDPVTGSGHSYRWYELTKVIKGKLVLNTYHYSSQTGQHVSKVRRLLRLLGAKFLEVEAPRGLQNLNVAFEHANKQLAQVQLANEHARKPTKHAASYWAKQAKLIRALGGRSDKPTDSYRSEALQLRTSRLERAKRMRAERKARQAAKLVPLTNDDMRDNEANVYHLQRSES